MFHDVQRNIAAISIFLNFISIYKVSATKQAW